eukprot:81725_1
MSRYRSYLSVDWTCSSCGLHQTHSMKCRECGQSNVVLFKQAKRQAEKVKQKGYSGCYYDEKGDRVEFKGDSEKGFEFNSICIGVGLVVVIGLLYFAFDDNVGKRK